MKLGKESRKLSKQLFRESFSGKALDAKKVDSLTAYVIDRKPRQYVGVLKEYARLLRLEIAKKHSVIESTTELDSATRDSISKTLQSRYGADVSTEFKVNPALIGGLRVQVGSDVLDASVRTRLDRLALELAA